MGAFAEGQHAALQPLFENFQTADVVDRLVGREILQRAGAADDLPFFPCDQLEVVLPERPVGDDRLGERALRLGRGQTQGQVDYPVAELAREIDAHPRRPSQIIEHRRQVLIVRQLHFEDHRVVFELFGQFYRGRGHDNGLAAVLERLDDVAQLAQDRGLILPAVMKIAQHEDAFVLGLCDGIECRKCVPSLQGFRIVADKLFEIVGVVPNI